MADNKSSGSLSVHAGCEGSTPKAPSQYGVKGKTSVDTDATRSSVAKNQKAQSGRTA